MAGFEINKGLVSIAIGYASGNYQYTKIDRYIAADQLNITPGRAQDLDSYVNANGHLKRNVLKHMRDGIAFSTPDLEYRDMQRLMHIFRMGMQQPDCIGLPEKKIRVRYFNEWTDDYDHGFFYVPDVQFQYGGTYKGYPMYLPVSMEFIEY